MSLSGNSISTFEGNAKIASLLLVERAGRPCHVGEDFPDALRQGFDKLSPEKCPPHRISIPIPSNESGGQNKAAILAYPTP